MGGVDWVKKLSRVNHDDDDYLTSLIIAGIDNLQTRREHVTEQFFLRNVLKEQSSLHYLLPTKRDLNIVNRLRHAKTLNSHNHELRNSENHLFHIVSQISNRFYELYYLFTYLHFFHYFV